MSAVKTFSPHSLFYGLLYIFMLKNIYFYYIIKNVNFNTKKV